MRRELYSRLILVGLLVLVGLFASSAWVSNSRVTTLQARMPEQGGWTPGELTARVGEPLQLRLVSEDVTHGFAVGQVDMVPIDLLPGEVEMVSLTFDMPGKYVYYCTRWCGPNHWRMRGMIEVLADSATVTEVKPANPLYIELGIDIDAPHPAQTTPTSKPEVSGVNDLSNILDGSFQTPHYYLSHSPAQAWLDLRRDPRMGDLSDGQVWSLVAAIWLSHTSAQELAAAEELYAANCAACHGESGDGDGVFAGNTEEPGRINQNDMAGQGLEHPTDFTDAEIMLGASPALLHGKIVRGGMGTGMPYWGPIFTDDQAWALVSYLYTFQFNYPSEVKP